MPRYSAGEQGDTETAGMIGALQERVDPTTIFAKRMELRHDAKMAFMYLGLVSEDLQSVVAEFCSENM